MSIRFTLWSNRVTVYLNSETAPRIGEFQGTDNESESLKEANQDRGLSDKESERRIESSHKDGMSK